MKNKKLLKFMELLKNKKLLVILSICLLIFSIGIVNKTFENDTYFTIRTGNYILQHGVDDVEPFTWHQNLKFTKLRWGFDIIVATIYNIAGFNGLYGFTVLMTGLIGISLFLVLVKRKNHVGVSFLITLLSMLFIGSGFTCRGQIMSYFCFVWEIYAIQMLLDTGKKKYSIYLVIISFMILTFHSSVWLAHFIFYLPYIFEWLLDKIKIKKTLEDNDKIEILSRDKENIKLMFITMGIVLLTGFLTPLKLSPFTYMFKVIGGYSSKIIIELQPTKIFSKVELLTFIIGSLVILAFTKTKVKITDICLSIGIIYMAKLARRNMPISIIVLAFTSASLITSYIKAFNKEKLFNKFDEKCNRSIPLLIIILLTFIMITVTNYSHIYKQPYVNEYAYPVEASKFIKENIDLSNAKIYNHFNYGSYMELQGIPTFIDSRSEVYCKEFNGVDILEDFARLSIDGTLEPEDVVQKYGITHFIIKEGNRVSNILKNDNRYKLLYDDKKFCVYEVIQTENVQ